MAAKKKNARGGIITLILAILLFASSAYAFSLGGAVILGVVAGVIGLGMAAMSVTLLKKSRSGSLN